MASSCHILCVCQPWCRVCAWQHQQKGGFGSKVLWRGRTVVSETEEGGRPSVVGRALRRGRLVKLWEGLRAQPSLQPGLHRQRFSTAHNPPLDTTPQPPALSSPPPPPKVPVDGRGGRAAGPGGGPAAGCGDLRGGEGCSAAHLAPPCLQSQTCQEWRLCACCHCRPAPPPPPPPWAPAASSRPPLAHAVCGQAGVACRGGVVGKGPRPAGPAFFTH